MASLPQITPEIINAYKQEVGKSASASTAKRKEVAIKRFFDWAHAQGKIDENPFQKKALQASQVANVSKAKNKFGFRTLAMAGLTLSLVILIFLLTRKLQLPIPFITNFAFNCRRLSCQVQRTGRIQYGHRFCACTGIGICREIAAKVCGCICCFNRDPC